MKKIYIGSDHAGYELKEKLKKYLDSLEYDVMDEGAYKLDEGDDYPDFIIPVAKSVIKDVGSLGIVLGGSGEGEEIAANKVDGIRACEYYGGNLEIVKLAREHNDANILCIPARFVRDGDAEKMLDIFMNTAFEGGRHADRVNKMAC